jgi:serine-type D-Ala-D-Ala carboxypeptidase
MRQRKIQFSLVFFFLCFFLFLPTSLATDDLNIGAESGILIESTTGKILYEKNSEKRMYPASTTKIMTAILTIEKCNLSDIATVSHDAVYSVPSGYSHANLKVGEELSINDLLNVLLIPSANDAANVLAEHIAGSVDEFCKMMNQKAKELGCKDTNFVNPNGVHNENHYSTAYDISLIARYAMQNETFRSYVKKTSCSLPATNKYDKTDRLFITTNDLLRVNHSSRADNYYYSYCNGIKTGYTSQAQNCLAASANRDGLEFITVVLGAGQTEDGLSQRNLDTISMFDYAFDHYTTKKLNEENSLLKQIKVKGATKETENLDVLIQDPINVIISKGNEDETFLPEIQLDENLRAPITKNSVIGSITYKIDDVQYTSNLLAANDVQKLDIFGIIFRIVAVIAILVIFFILKQLTFHKKKKNYRTRKR